MTIKSVSTTPKCTALYNLLLKYLWFPYKIKVIMNDLLCCVFYGFKCSTAFKDCL